MGKVKEIGAIFLKNGVITKEQLEFCLDHQKQSKEKIKIGRILKYYNFVTDDDIAKALAEQVGWKFYDQEYVPHLPAVEKIGIEFLKDKVFLPVETENSVAFVFAHPYDTDATDIAIEKGYRDAEFFIGSEGTISWNLDILIGRQSKTRFVDKVNAFKEGFKGDEAKEAVDELINNAITQYATDIHIEPGEKVSTIRYRIDGILHSVVCMPMELHNNLINIIFTKADIQVSDYRKFHDGKFRYKYLTHDVDIRVSSIPSTHGATIVLRLLDMGKTLISIQKLGFYKTHYDAIWRAIEKPYGITIITGPTGSGKTTTLYALLNCIKAISIKIVTVEDPVEIQMPLISQVEVDGERVTFANSVRAFLRHDPDVILIGEIRDSETAIEATRASITGHRVFSTLHTNTTVDAIYRLHDLGVELNVIANSLVCAVSQRLARKLCPTCKKKVILNWKSVPAGKQKYLEQKDEIITYEPGGCARCKEGYRGRTVAAEVLLFDNAIRILVAQGKLEEVRKFTERAEFTTLQQDVARLVKEGVTSLDEAVRITG